MATLCNAPTRSGGTCKRVAGASGRCYWHGEAAGRLRELPPPQKDVGGVVLPQRQHNGRWANEIPARLLDKYKLAADDPDILSLHADIALLDTRIAEVLKRVDAGESGALIEKALAILDEADAAHETEEGELVGRRLGELRELLTEGRNDHTAWLEVIALLEQRRKLAETESKRRTKARMMMRVDDLLTYAKALTEATRRHVTDPAIRTAIGREFVHILGLPDRSVDESGGQPTDA